MGHLGFFIRGQKGIVCWAKVINTNSSKKTIAISVAGGEIDLMSSSGLKDICEYIYRFLQKGLDEA